ncbi:MAG: SRPBCC family protein [Candidatus Nanopelagicales bacterium]
MRLVTSRQIAAPAERVWALATDIEASPRMISGIDSVEVVAGAPEFGVGTRWRETRTMYGRQATEELEVIAVTEGREYSVVTDGNGTRYEAHFLIEPDASDSCTLTTTFGATPTSLISWLLARTVGRLFVASSRTAMENDLADLARAAEDHAG